MIDKCLLVIFAIGTAAHAANITATVQQASYSTEDLIPVGISVSNISDLYAFQFDLSFDPAVLSAQLVTEAGYFLSNGVSFSPGAIDNTTGTISFIADTLSGSGPGFSGQTSLGTVTFMAVGPGIASVAPMNVVLLDGNLSEIPAAASGAQVNVSGATITPEPSSLISVGMIVLAIIVSRRTIKRRLQR